MLFYPLVLGRRRSRGEGAGPLSAVGEYLMLLLASAPLYVAAAWLSDAIAGDVARALLHLTSVAVGAWGLGLWIRKGHPAIATAAALAATIVALGMPVTYYLLAELTERAVCPDWLFLAAPATGERRSPRGLSAARAARATPRPGAARLADPRRAGARPRAAPRRAARPRAPPRRAGASPRAPRSEAAARSPRRINSCSLNKTPEP